jgi:hypothetical protein
MGTVIAVSKGRHEKLWWEWKKNEKNDMDDFQMSLLESDGRAKTQNIT